jgi:hypothetical protein
MEQSPSWEITSHTTPNTHNQVVYDWHHTEFVTFWYSNQIFKNLSTAMWWASMYLECLSDYENARNTLPPPNSLSPPSQTDEDNEAGKSSDNDSIY